MCDKSPQKIKNMFDNIAPYYDQMNDYISVFTHKIIKKSAVKLLKIKPNSLVLDLCCGSGDFSEIITKIEQKAKVIGLDSSLNMLKLARRKHPELVFMEGDCTDLPFNNEFDYITIGFGLRNLQNRELAISQIYKFLHLSQELFSLQ